VARSRADPRASTTSAASAALELQAAATAAFAVLTSVAQETGGLAMISLKVAPVLAQLERLAEKRK
jgi:hypothetical protein